MKPTHNRGISGYVSPRLHSSSCNKVMKDRQTSMMTPTEMTVSGSTPHLYPEGLLSLEAEEQQRVKEAEGGGREHVEHLHDVQAHLDLLPPSLGLGRRAHHHLHPALQVGLGGEGRLGERGEREGGEGERERRG